MTDIEIANQLRFRYYTPRHFEGVRVLDFEQFELYQELNTRYLQGIERFDILDSVIILTGIDRLKSVRMYSEKELVGGIDLEYDATIAAEIIYNIRKCFDADGPIEFLKKSMTGKFFREMSIESGLKFSIGCCDYIRAALQEVKARPPAYRITDTDGNVIGEIDFGTKKTSF